MELTDMCDTKKPVLGISPIRFVNEERDRIDFNRAIEICQGIIRHCGEMEPWPLEYDEELEYISSGVWNRKIEGGDGS